MAKTKREREMASEAGRVARALAGSADYEGDVSNLAEDVAMVMSGAYGVRDMDPELAAHLEPHTSPRRASLHRGVSQRVWEEVYYKAARNALR